MKYIADFEVKVSRLGEEKREYCRERVALLEYHQGLDRASAEAQVFVNLRSYQSNLTAFLHFITPRQGYNYEGKKKKDSFVTSCGEKI